jgi:hypothetical protein
MDPTRSYCISVCDGNKIKQFKDYYVDTSTWSCTYALGNEIDDCSTKNSDDTEGTSGDDTKVPGSCIDYTTCDEDEYGAWCVESDIYDYDDECVNETHIREWYASGASCTYTDVDCSAEAGYRCVDKDGNVGGNGGRAACSDVCQNFDPTLQVNPTSRWGTVGAEVEYTVSITNNDNGYCAARDFDLSSDVGNLPLGWEGSFSQTSFTLNPGDTGQSSFKVKSNISDEGYKDYVINITLTTVDKYGVTHTYTVSVVYTLVPNCVFNVTLDPASDKVVGETYTWDVDVTDTSLLSCPDSIEYKVSYYTFGTCDSENSYTWPNSFVINRGEFLEDAFHVKVTRTRVICTVYANIRDKWGRLITVGEYSVEPLCE